MEINSLENSLAIDLEWWFHGPPNSQHMMRILERESLYLEFKFEPRNISVIDDRVIVEGWEGNEAYWVHSTSIHGLLYRDLRMSDSLWEIKQIRPTVWQSEPREHLKRSLPGLVLAI
ncbi:hypothetical protein MKW92_039726 [Papaver armeniacum]|nr:hypothetical protein MKW92_039726 [Papaver armeniacum]